MTLFAFVVDELWDSLSWRRSCSQRSLTSDKAVPVSEPRMYTTTPPITRPIWSSFKLQFIFAHFWLIHKWWNNLLISYFDYRVYQDLDWTLVKEAIFVIDLWPLLTQVRIFGSAWSLLEIGWSLKQNHHGQVKLTKWCVQLRVSVLSVIIHIQTVLYSYRICGELVTRHCKQHSEVN